MRRRHLSLLALLLPLGLIAVGAISFFALLASDPNRAWQSYVSNWLSRYPGRTRLAALNRLPR